ncbi:MAG: hypothetical protein R2796_03680 [Chitinophagaceae bacterium]|nr:hypothetical protein [Chitinophagaceae bacterium]MCB0740817.1 hypothetical protein [Chitinophagaceae bacterium]HQU56020.1 hypothetical protein [Chitinophagaceae bacterium]HQV05308.1 hypothetical protein [Chitinophagaceae bacterium]
MKNQSPIKRHPAIVSFSKDHHFALLLVWKIRQGIDNGVATERISKYVSYFFEEDLKKHFREEEALLYGELPVDDVLRKRAETDHQKISGLIKAVTENKNDTVLLHQLADAVEENTRFEERTLLNHLQQLIPSQKLERLADRVPVSSQALDDNWKDVFWEIPNNTI